MKDSTVLPLHLMAFQALYLVSYLLTYLQAGECTLFVRFAVYSRLTCIHSVPGVIYKCASRSSWCRHRSALIIIIAAMR